MTDRLLARMQFLALLVICAVIAIYSLTLTLWRDIYGMSEIVRIASRVLSALTLVVALLGTLIYGEKKKLHEKMLGFVRNRVFQSLAWLAAICVTGLVAISLCLGVYVLSRVVTIDTSIRIFLVRETRSGNDRRLAELPGGEIVRVMVLKNAKLAYAPVEASEQLEALRPTGADRYTIRENEGGPVIELGMPKPEVTSDPSTSDPTSSGGSD